METMSKIVSVLDAMGLQMHAELKRYYEPHRFYHGMGHIEYMIDQYTKLYLDSSYYTEEEREDIFLAVIFHDIIYDPKANDNEEQSAKLANHILSSAGFPHHRVNRIVEAILKTKTPWVMPEEKIARSLVHLDILGLCDFKTAMKNDKLIFKEYSFVEWSTYKSTRLNIIKKISKTWHVSEEYMLYLQDDLEKNIAVYAGSFDPFHVGHQNILEKAEKIFDKVIVARGSNPSKGGKEFDLPKEYLKYRQVDEYNGLLTDYISSKKYDVTIIRGMRNATDLQLEQDQSKYLRELKPDIRIVNIMCDHEYEHISSSFIKNLYQYGKGSNYIVK